MPTDQVLSAPQLRTVIGALVLLAIALFAGLAHRTIATYRSTFVSTISAGLKHNFIVADPKTLFAVSLVLLMVFGTVAFWMVGPLGAVTAALVATIGPRMVVARYARRRTSKFIYQLPDALLALASALRAGSNLTKGLELLATRQPPPLSQEFTIVLAEYRVGRQLAESLSDMRKRMQTPELDLMNTAMNVSRRVGGNLADTLDSLARTLQEKAHIEGKIDALTSMGRAQGWVVGVLPVFIGFVLYQQQPERMSLMFKQWYGWLVLGVIATMMGTAAWMIRKIVRIDV
ncbi:MAG: type II secretion system F family protein [Steroidobacteraceae bacterium]